MSQKIPSSSEPILNKLGGISIKGTPINGQRLQFNSALNIFEWVTPSGGGGGKATVVYGADGATINDPVIEFHPIAFESFSNFDESLSQIIFPKAGTFKNARLQVTFNNHVNPTIFTLRVNGVDVAIKITIPPLTIGTFSDLVNTLLISGGDRVNWKTDPILGGNNVDTNVNTIEFLES